METILKQDTYLEHIFHCDHYDPKCSTCYTERKCIGCGGRATRTNYTLCQDCWNDAEGENE
jgi:hypothetical protein